MCICLHAQQCISVPCAKNSNQVLHACHTIHGLVNVAGTVSSFIRIMLHRSLQLQVLSRDQRTSTTSTAKYTELPPSAFSTKSLGVINLSYTVFTTKKFLSRVNHKIALQKHMTAVGNYFFLREKLMS